MDKRYISRMHSAEYNPLLLLDQSRVVFCPKVTTIQNFL